VPKVALELIREERVEDSLEDAFPLIESLDKLPGGRDAYPVLAAVQPYGETLLSGDEAARLTDELRAIAELPQETPLRALARNMLAVATAAKRDEAFSVRFAGD
jgi:hypothetical protein